MKKNVKEISNLKDKLKDKEYNLAAFKAGTKFKIKKKLISPEQKERLKKVAEVAISVATIGFILVITADLMVNPECYFTTHPNFVGTGGLTGPFSRVCKNLMEIVGGLKR